MKKKTTIKKTAKKTTVKKLSKADRIKARIEKMGARNTVAAIRIKSREVKIALLKKRLAELK